MPRLVARLAVAALVAAAVGVGVSAPAHASTCGTASGVSVVVDFHQLGGGVQRRCDRDDADDTAWEQLAGVHFQLTPVTRQPGFICRIDGEPADDPCVNTPPSNAYWSLWWSDGRSGKWTYSSTGAGSLKVPAGGYVGMSWQGGAAQAPPGVSPTPHAARPSSSPSPRPTSSPHPSSAPGQAPPTYSAPGTPKSSATPGATSNAAKNAHRKPRHLDPSKLGKAGRRSTHGPDRTQAAEPLDRVAPSGAYDSAASGSGGLPGWVAPVAIGVLFAGAGTIALVRRKPRGGA